MPLKLSPSQIAFNARGDGKFNKPFKEQVAFFRQKLNLPSQHWDDILTRAHDRAFIVAGAAKADLLQDLRGAVDKAISQGKSIQAFRKDFAGIVQKRGWQGWTGSDTKAGRNWRTKVIYTTNMRSSYAAGRELQLQDPALRRLRPYLKYIHNDTVTNPRHLHVSWSGKVLRHDDPWWDMHKPPNGFGCRCRVVAVSKREFKGDVAPNDGTYSKIDRHGVEHIIPKGIDYGFDYAPGQSNAPLLRQVIAKQDNADWQLARDNVAALVASDVFVGFFNGTQKGEFPIAVLNPRDKTLLKTDNQVVVLSRESVDKHLTKHPEIRVDDYRQIQDVIDNGDVYQQGDERLIYINKEGVTYRAALKRTGDGMKNYFLTLFKNERAKPPGDAVKIER